MAWRQGVAAGSRGCVASLTHLWASKKCAITVVTLDSFLFLTRGLSVGGKADSGRDVWDLVWVEEGLCVWSGSREPC